MEANFTPALARVLVYEGGKSDDPRDPGGRTNQGVTQRTYTDYLRSIGVLTSRRDVYEMTAPERDAIYLTRYWAAIGGDALPPGLDFAVFDAAVNSGPGTAIRWLQNALGVIADGALGPSTRVAIAGVVSENSVHEIIAKFCSLRLGSLECLPTWKVYGAGWHARIANCEQIALAWENQTGPVTKGAGKAGAGVGPAPVKVTSAGGNVKAAVAPQTVVKPPVSPLTMQGATIAAAIATAAAQGIQALAPASDVVPIVKYVLLALVAAFMLAGFYVTALRHAATSAAMGMREAEVDTTADRRFPSVDLNTVTNNTASADKVKT